MPDNMRITDARALRALAHPARNRILERLQVRGPATATECATVAGLSPSACSYHLRLLERYGFVEKAERADRTDGRERLWKATVRGWSSAPEQSDDPRQTRAVDMALVRVLLDSSDEKVLSWVDGAGEEPATWRDAWLVSNNSLALTPKQLDELTTKIQVLLAPYRLDDAGAVPDGARVVHAALRLVPTRDTGRE
jgi:DNA-binding transcriptional ArsR family regulator